MTLEKKKRPQKHFHNCHQSCILLTDRIESYQLQPLEWPSNLLHVMLSGRDWWILIWSVNNTQDWWKFWKRFCGCFVFQSHVWTKTVVTVLCTSFWKLRETSQTKVTKINLESVCDVWAYQQEGAGMAQWCERLPPTNVSQVRFTDPASYVGWVCCWFS